MKTHLTELLSIAANTIIEKNGLTDLTFSVVLDRPKSADHGDFATNLAMQLAKPLKQNPRAIAESIIQNLPASPYIAKAEIAGAGFINFFLNAGSQQAIVKTIEWYLSNEGWVKNIVSGEYKNWIQKNYGDKT